MSGFHPALTGVLYGALAQHEQALIQMALAANIAQADVDPEIAERYGAIVDGLKRMIAMSEPSGPGGLASIEVIEKKRLAYVVLGRLQELLPEFDISWNLHLHAIEATLLPRAGNDEVRKDMSVVADRLGIDYIERSHGSSGTSLIVCAKGEIEGIPVRIYDLIEAERSICDTHRVMVDVDGVCSECSAALVHAGIPGTDMPRCDAPRGRRTTLTQVNVTCPDCQALLAGAGAGEADEDETADDGGAYEGGFTDAQLAGTSCSECGVDFTEGAATDPTGAGVRERLAAHPDCLTDTTTEPPGDAPSTDAGLLQASVLPVADIETPSPKRKARPRHAPMPERSELPLCGRPFGCRVAASHADVSCPTCLELMAREQSGDDETESTSTEPPGDAL